MNRLRPLTERDIQTLRKSTEIKVSVIIPVYNVKRYIEKCLDTLVNQTLRDIEVICVDDGSTDGTESILETYAVKDSRFRVIHKINEGAGAARNVGLQMAEGEYVIFLDADDYFEYTMLEKLYGISASNSLDVMLFFALFFDDVTGKEIPSNEIKKEYLPDKTIFSRSDMPNHILDFSQHYPWNKLFRRQFIMDNDLKFQTVIHTNDVCFVSLALVKAERIMVLNEKLLYYRNNVADSLTASSTRQRYPFIVYDVLSNIKEELEKMGIYADIEQSFLNMALGQFLYNLSRIRGYAYYQFYNKLRYVWSKELSLNEHGSSYYYPGYFNYNQYRTVMALPAWKAVGLHRRIKRGKGRPYYFKFGELKENSRVVLYGAGKVGQAYYHAAHKRCQVVLWVDGNYKSLLGVVPGPVHSPETIKKIKFDYIIIAVENSEAARQIKETICKLGVVQEKILWRQPRLFLV